MFEAIRAGERKYSSCETTFKFLVLIINFRFSDNWYTCSCRSGSCGCWNQRWTCSRGSSLSASSWGWRCRRCSRGKHRRRCRCCGRLSCGHSYRKQHRLSTYILTHAYINKKQFRFHLLIKMSICPPLMKLKYYICKREHVLYSCTVKIPNDMEVVLLVI